MKAKSVIKIVLVTDMNSFSDSDFDNSISDEDALDMTEDVMRSVHSAYKDVVEDVIIDEEMMIQSRVLEKLWDEGNIPADPEINSYNDLGDFHISIIPEKLEVLEKEV